MVIKDFSTTSPDIQNLTIGNDFVSFSKSTDFFLITLQGDRIMLF